METISKFFRNLTAVLVFGTLNFFVGNLTAQTTVDVFPGWSGKAISGGWTMVVVEIVNKGDPIHGSIEIVDDNLMEKQVALLRVEVPSQSNKRFWLYFHTQSFHGFQGKLRLLDERHRKRVEQLVKIEWRERNVSMVAESLPPRSGRMGLIGGKVFGNRSEWVSTRILRQHLPDFYVGYDGLRALHLGWSDISDVSQIQRQALLDWVKTGGHLIVSAEDSTAWKLDPFWKAILPFEVVSRQEVSGLGPLHSWTQERMHGYLLPKKSRNLEGLSSLPTLLGLGNLMHGKELIRGEEGVVVAQQRWGRGVITQLLFDPGSEPFLSWKGREMFWRCLLQAPHDHVDALLYEDQVRMENAGNGGKIRRIKMNEGRQLHASSLENFITNNLSTHRKRFLPWVFLSVILVGYVLLIGPIDYIVLKRKRKQVWTWVTFPITVLAATLLIYYLGQWANKGDSEWRQWTVLDGLSGSGRLTGTTFSSFYSARNREYEWMDAPDGISQVRDVSPGNSERSDWSNRLILNTPSATVVKAEIPIWTSGFFGGRIACEGPVMEGLYDPAMRILKMKNPTAENWPSCRWVTGPEKYYSLGELKAGETREWKLDELKHCSIATEVRNAMQNNFLYGRYHYLGGYGSDEGEGNGVRGFMELNDLNLDKMQTTFFAPQSFPEFDRGSVGDGVELSDAWQEDDAFFMAAQKRAEGWPWVLNFRPGIYSHTLIHRIHFSSDEIVLPPNLDGVEMEKEE